MSFFDNMFLGGDKHEHWLDLKKETQLHDLFNESKQKPVAIFKHSTRCGISHMVKDQLHGKYDIDPNELSFYYLDLLSYRPLSNKVAEAFKVPHQSPQLILLKDGDVVYNASHHMINLDSVRSHLG